MLRVAPDAREAARDEQAVRRVARGVLTSAGHPATAATGPALMAAAFAAQHGGAVEPTGSRLISSPGPPLALEPAEPGPAHSRSVARALAARPAGADASAGSRPTGWLPSERAALARSAARLGDAWPQLLAELRVCVAQVVLLEGRAIDGFTDFATHGAVYLNRARLGTSPLGLPGPVRLAEALVHEGTHTRCNAAQLGSPFVTPAAGGADLVRTPLRADPRPVTGLFQQAVVLVRCAELYRRLLRDQETDLGVLADRRQKLVDGARQALATLREHGGLLTEHGLAVLDQCEGLLRPSGV
ncbi:HEXXH motif-containing putative peptide modification protein [Kitasatospora sp. NBC_01287]|uniref:aKG-HExxH-type peptide beta-hydroxylase n=1 Tax=Kitasatospora sp. NBC_01287 TaxID=2903573 RepID=UPI00224D33B9|nr:HEXXH motif-containing putative peptide modification protein [Kitasatospora sp. NBC_01287]MCX4750377.1 HEXXH motif-containing putative peptide modification protein [Kitasatospora sp. NBC_01287]